MGSRRDLGPDLVNDQVSVIGVGIGSPVNVKTLTFPTPSLHERRY